jgi:hypothetical protein
MAGMSGNPGEGEDILAFGDPERRGSGRLKRLALAAALGGMVAAGVAIGLTATAGTPAPAARSTAVSSRFQASYAQAQLDAAILQLEMTCPGPCPIP